MAGIYHRCTVIVQNCTDVFNIRYKVASYHLMITNKSA